MLTNEYEVVIGLEVHAQLLTNSKMFCGDSAAYGAAPNTHVSPISLGHPGTLPVINEKAIQLAVRLGLALNCDINPKNYFARKNYFYPDLPKGYQVTQDTEPICKGGHLIVNDGNSDKKIRLNRIHLEEDAGKSIHDADADYTCIDINRAGVPLVEIVTEPDLASADEAYAFLTELRKLLRWLNVCDGNMEEGSMRCDANISVRLKGEKKLGTRVEVKNLNSIRNVKRAITFEAGRLMELLEKAEPILQQTRSYDADTNTTFLLRTKEAADDYRYFPEPDLPPVYLPEDFVATVKHAMPALPGALKNKYISEFHLSDYDATALTADRETADYFEEAIQFGQAYKMITNLLAGPVKQYCNENNESLATYPVLPNRLAGLAELVSKNEISYQNAAGPLLTAMLQNETASIHALATSLHLLQEVNSIEIEAWVNVILAAAPDKVAAYKKGSKNLLGLFAGAVKKLSKGKADMAAVNKLLIEKLENDQSD
ncbi:MAG: Asp-tRNA(Asn)/Glu-tRNA(Gln) amidotransferase subunit GatB [Ferruginibacter sp.]